MAKDEKKTIIIDEVEHIYEDLTGEQQIMVNHIADLQRKIASSQFNLQQLEFGKEAFVKALKDSIDSIEAVETE